MFISSLAGRAKPSNDNICEAEVGADGIYGSHRDRGATAEVGEVDVEVCVGEPVRDLLSELVDAVAFSGVLVEELVCQITTEIVT
jgi:hypothetical protein